MREQFVLDPLPTAVVGMLLRFAAVAALLVGSLWLWSKIKKRRPNGRLRLIEELRLSGQTTVFLVGLDDRHFLLGSGAQGVTLLSEIPKQQPDPTTHTENVSPALAPPDRAVWTDGIFR